MSDFLQLVISGLGQGTIYGLVAIGFVVIFTVSGVVNLVQGEFAILAGFTAISLLGMGVPLVLAMVIGVAVVGGFSMGMQRLAIAPVRRMTVLTSIILTLGISTALKGAMLLYWGPEAQSLPALPGSHLHIAGVTIRAQEVWIFAVGALLAGAVIWFYERTLAGKALLACSEQPVAARLVGIAPGRARRNAFLIAGVVGGVAGVLASPIYFTSWEAGLVLGLKGFVAAVLAGLISVRGAMIGGLVLGVLENLTAGYVDSGLRDAVAFIVLVVVLVARPSGVFARETEERV
ncbi:branched-chain amino acid ABC transporter permease [Spiractinospora alimapuensis]|uniref:branched-chain amino acid ABC transporter permease n=1 Tax=Spiractinospora alimapuensis TaxID=2820884 RepID=UPI001F345079|nr:branched-chain amino acid ABC transporter permease [Spiractinospora alimapuensis]QVQ53734.1 branched-chain amino acid ABC transporter permease [Spiractinospora alimapuensis]